MTRVPVNLLLPHERAARRTRALVFGLGTVVGLLVVTLLDQWLWRTLTLERAVFERVERRDYYQLARQFGYLPTWLLIAACVWLLDRGPRRAGLVGLSAALGGGVAELVKVVVQRFRPGTDGEYVFRWMTGDIPNAHLLKGLGLASSHAGVAFGGAFMVAVLWPRLGWVAVGAAVACSLTRLVSGAHFASDVYVAAVLSYCVARVLWDVERRRRG